MAYQYPYEKVTVQNDEDFVVAAHHNLQENQLFELTEAVKALDDFKAEFPDKTGDTGKLVAVNGAEDGFEYVDPPSGGGLAEPGLICYVDSDFLYEGGGPGFSPGLPIDVLTSREITVDEDFILLVLTDASEEGLVAVKVFSGQPPNAVAWYENVIWFNPTGTIYVGPNWQDLSVRLGVWDNIGSRWLDLHSVHVTASGGGPL
jgi:hypothetical protein